jgi:hypothetical protein
MTIMEGAPIECIICGGRQRKDLVTINGWTVKSCMQCGFGVLDPRPSVADIVKLYDEQYCHDRFEDGGEPGTQKFTHRLSLESSRLRLIKYWILVAVLAISWRLAVTTVIRFMALIFQVSRSTMPLQN